MSRFAAAADVFFSAAKLLMSMTFAATTNTSGSSYTALYSFAGPGADGANPRATLVMDAAGNLYGTTLNGGTAGNG